MATTQRAVPARRTPTPRKSTAAATSRSAGAAGSTPAKAATRGPRPAGTEHRRPRRTAAPAPVADTTERPSPSPQRAAAQDRVTSAEPARREAGLVRRTAATVPVLHVRVPVLRVRVPDVGAWVAQTGWAVRANVPPTERLLYYGGLGLAAVVGLVEWPVAVAVGAGVWVASRSGERRRRQAVSA